ncbi:MAG: hypothetical protein KAV87_24785 [Desulfobacteraceae bacterium]|nr:hypothetical protein [Desulfobacteraceae bacterium]
MKIKKAFVTWQELRAMITGGELESITHTHDMVEDTSPQLGGDLNLNGKNIDFPTVPNISDCLDEDNMASDSPTKLATQQSIKAYVDASGGGDKIEEGNSSVEVIDAGVGYIETKADGLQVRKDAVLGNIQPLQPAFFAYLSATASNVTGDGTQYTLPCNTELYDQGGNYASPTFTAPITGKYFINYGITISGILLANANFLVWVSTSNRDYIPQYGDSYQMAKGTGGNMSISGTLLVDLDANDTAIVKIAVQDGTKVVDIIGHVNDPKTYMGMTLMV